MTSPAIHQQVTDTGIITCQGPRAKSRAVPIQSLMSDTSKTSVLSAQSDRGKHKPKERVMEAQDDKVINCQ